MTYCEDIQFQIQKIKQNNELLQNQIQKQTNEIDRNQQLIANLEQALGKQEEIEKWCKRTKNANIIMIKPERSIISRAFSQIMMNKN